MKLSKELIRRMVGSSGGTGGSGGSSDTANYARSQRARYITSAADVDGDSAADVGIDEVSDVDSGNTEVSSLIGTPFQEVNTNTLGFGAENGCYAVGVTSQVAQIGFTMDLSCEGNELLIVNCNSTQLGMWNVDSDTKAFALQKTEVRYVYLAPGAHLRVKAIKRQTLISSTSTNDCIWLILNPYDFDLSYYPGSSTLYQVTSKTIAMP